MIVATASFDGEEMLEEPAIANISWLAGSNNHRRWGMTGASSGVEVPCPLRTPTGRSGRQPLAFLAE
jgi:hypothetical protein